jgi:hypothetical protein
MTFESLAARVKPWIHPQYPGLNKNIAVGMLCGLLGPIGVGVFLRSVFDLALSALAAGLAIVLLGEDALGGMVSSVVCSLWVLGRIMWDTKRSRDEERGGPAAALAGAPRPTGPFRASGAAPPPSASPQHTPHHPARPDLGDMRLAADDPGHLSSPPALPRLA